MKALRDLGRWIETLEAVDAARENVESHRRAGRREPGCVQHALRGVSMSQSEQDSRLNRLEYLPNRIGSLIPELKEPIMCS